MTVHKEANATLLGKKILVVHDKISKKPHVCATTGKDKAQYMIVEGRSKPAFAIIDVKLKLSKQR